MKSYEWSKEKSDQLKKERGICFEEVVLKLEAGEVIDIISNPSSNFPNQKVYIVKIYNYIYYIPFVEKGEKVFLKTIIPSRKVTKKYINLITS